MTKKQLLDVLTQCQDLDIESGHIEADAALLEFIGDQDITDAFESLQRWYA